MPKAFPIEFRNDVVAVARKGEASIAQVAKDFGVSESCLQRWLKLDDIEAGKRPGPSRDESAELRELRKRNRLLEQEAEVMRRAVARSSINCARASACRPGSGVRRMKDGCHVISTGPSGVSSTLPRRLARDWREGPVSASAAVAPMATVSLGCTKRRSSPSHHWHARTSPASGF